jgi:hypothetical protein
MSERAAIYRGTVVAGPSVAGWLVEARIPIAPVPRSTRSPVRARRPTTGHTVRAQDDAQDEKLLSRPAAPLPLANSPGPGM